MKKNDFFFKNLKLLFHFLHLDVNSHDTFLEKLIQSEELHLLYIFALVCSVGLVWLLVKLYCVSESRKNMQLNFVGKPKYEKCQSRYRNFSESTKSLKFRAVKCDQKVFFYWPVFLIEQQFWLSSLPVEYQHIFWIPQWSRMVSFGQNETLKIAIFGRKIPKISCF